MAVTNGVLAYIKAFRQRADTQSIKDSILSCCDDKALRTAKEALWANCQDELKQLKLEYSRRRGTATQSQADADFDDIVAAFDALDTEGLAPEVLCSSNDLLLLPPPLPLRGIDELSDELKSLRSEVELKLDGIDRQLQSMSQSVAVTPTAEVNKTVPPPRVNVSDTASPANKANLDDLQRRSNVVIYGVTENKSLTETHELVDSLFKCATGKPIPIWDMFRLGKKKQEISSRPRPLLVKLQCAWDRRIILAGKRNLFDDPDFKLIFINPDLNLEERQKLMQRLANRRANREQGHNDTSQWVVRAYVLERIIATVGITVRYLFPNYFSVVIFCFFSSIGLVIAKAICYHLMVL